MRLTYKNGSIYKARWCVVLRLFFLLLAACAATAETKIWLDSYDHRTDFGMPLIGIEIFADGGREDIAFYVPQWSSMYYCRDMDLAPEGGQVSLPSWGFAVATYVGLLLSLIAFRREWRADHAKRWLSQHLCSNCNYDLRASKDRCPECGTPIPPKTSDVEPLSQPESPS
jgi:hypothetical protein